MSTLCLVRAKFLLNEKQRMMPSSLEGKVPALERERYSSAEHPELCIYAFVS